MSKAPSLSVPSIGNPRRVIRRVTENLPTRLTDEEKWDAAARACDLLNEYDVLDELKKFQAKVAGDKLKSLRIEMSREARSVKTGQVDRDVDVEDVYDMIEDTVRRVRTDTGEVLFSRKATDAERDTAPEFS